ncbi:MAG: lysylphosphatidylglycerol synthase transmembrane domain-containing protein [Eubacteriaceae bacterium]
MGSLDVVKKNKLKSFWKKYSNYIFFVFLISATCLVILTQVDPKTFVNAIKETKIAYLFVGIGCVFVYWLLEAYMLLMLMRRDKPDENISFAFTLTIVGQYYNLITPSATGGQPLQLYEMLKRGYSFGTGTAVLVQKYALYQVTVTLLAIIGTILSTVALHFGLVSAKWLIFIGLIVNIAGVVLIFVLALNANAAKSMMIGVVKFLIKLHILKDFKKYSEKIDRFIMEYSIAISALKKHHLETLRLFIVSIIQILFFYSINYWVYRAIGLRSETIFSIICLQSILYVAVAFIPTPGAAGGAEAGFLLIFGGIYGAMAPIAMILWRIITFYFIIMFGGVFLSFKSIRVGKNKMISIDEEVQLEKENKEKYIEETENK